MTGIYPGKLCQCVFNIKHNYKYICETLKRIQGRDFLEKNIFNFSAQNLKLIFKMDSLPVYQISFYFEHNIVIRTNALIRMVARTMEKEGNIDVLNCYILSFICFCMELCINVQIQERIHTCILSYTHTFLHRFVQSRVSVMELHALHTYSNVQENHNIKGSDYLVCNTLRDFYKAPHSTFIYIAQRSNAQSIPFIYMYYP